MSLFPVDGASKTSGGGPGGTWLRNTSFTAVAAAAPAAAAGGGGLFPVFADSKAMPSSSAAAAVASSSSSSAAASERARKSKSKSKGGDGDSGDSSSKRDRHASDGSAVTDKKKKKKRDESDDGRRAGKERRKRKHERTRSESRSGSDSDSKRRSRHRQRSTHRSEAERKRDSIRAKALVSSDDSGSDLAEVNVSGSDADNDAPPADGTKRRHKKTDKEKIVEKEKKLRALERRGARRPAPAVSTTTSTAAAIALATADVFRPATAPVTVPAPTVPNGADSGAFFDDSVLLVDADPLASASGVDSTPSQPQARSKSSAAYAATGSSSAASRATESASSQAASAALSAIPASALFRVDTVGDNNNTIYEQLYSSDIPTYIRVGRAAVLLGVNVISHWKQPTPATTDPSPSDSRSRKARTTTIPDPILIPSQPAAATGVSLDSHAIRELLTLRGPGQVQTAIDKQREHEWRLTKQSRYFSTKNAIVEREQRSKRRINLPASVSATATASQPAPEPARWNWNESFVSLQTPNALSVGDTDDDSDADTEADADTGAAADDDGSGPAPAAAASGESKARNDTAANARRSQKWEDYVRDQRKAFNVATRERPHDIALWLRFVDFQDETVAAHRKNVSGPMAEQKLAILAKALTHNPNSEPLMLARLHTGARYWAPDKLLEEWEKAVQSGGGGAAGGSSSNRPRFSTRLWKEYLLFRQSQFSSFSVSTARSVYAHAIQTLTAQRQTVLFRRMSKDRRRASLYEIEETLLSVLVRVCALEKQSGFTERSVALFQALIEFNCFTPLELAAASLDQRRAAFREFWESDVTRIGEQSAAHTWRGWYRAQSIAAPPPLGSDTAPPAAAADTPPVERWLAAESAISRTEWKPARDIPPSEAAADRRAGAMNDGDSDANSSDSDADSDSTRLRAGGRVRVRRTHAECSALDRVVLFEDLSDFLFDISDQSLRRELVYQSIASHDIFALPSARALLATNSGWSVEHQHSTEWFESVPAVLGWSVANAQRTQQQQQPAAGAAAAAAATTAGGVDLFNLLSSATRIRDLKTLIAGDDAIPTDPAVAASVSAGASAEVTVRDRSAVDWFAISQTTVNEVLTGNPSRPGADPSRVDWIRNTLQTAISAGFAESSNLRVFALLFEAVSGGGIDSARKLARTMLKADSTNLMLWNAYAQAEIKHSRFDEARKVYDKALSLYSALPAPAQRVAPILYCCYALMEIQCAFMPAVISGGTAPPLTVREERLNAALHVLLSIPEPKFVPYSSPAAITPVRIMKARKTYSELLGIDPNAPVPTLFAAASGNRNRNPNLAAATVRRSRFDEKLTDQTKRDKVIALWSLETATAPATISTTAPAQQKQPAGDSESDSDDDFTSSDEDEKKVDASEAERRSRARFDERERVLTLFHTQSTQTSEYTIGCAGVSVGAALTVCAAWTEYLTRGLPAATAIFQNILSRTTPPAGTAHVTATERATTKATAAAAIAAAASDRRTARRAAAAAAARQHKEEDDLFLHGGTQHEWLILQYVHLLSAHRTTQPTPPAIIRDALLYALRVFPNNAYFLSVYIGLESKSQLTAQLRRYFDSIMTPQSAGGATASRRGGSSGGDVFARSLTPVVWMQAMSCELSRAGASHRIHRIFHKALMSGVYTNAAAAITNGGAAAITSSTSVALWRFFLFYLLAPKQPFPVAPTPPPAPAPLPPPPNDGLTRPKPKLSPAQLAYSRDLVAYERAVHDLRVQCAIGKKFWYRAIHTCPASKQLWIDGLTLLRAYGDLFDDELTDALLLMREKQIRIRVQPPAPPAPPAPPPAPVQPPRRVEKPEPASNPPASSTRYDAAGQPIPGARLLPSADHCSVHART